MLVILQARLHPCLIELGRMAHAHPSTVLPAWLRLWNSACNTCLFCGYSVSWLTMSSLCRWRQTMWPPAAAPESLAGDTRFLELDLPSCARWYFSLTVEIGTAQEALLPCRSEASEVPYFAIYGVWYLSPCL
jgi:hypothetical protein